MKLTFPLLNTTINVPVDDSMTAGKVSRRTALRKKSEKITESTERSEKLDNSSVGDDTAQNKPPMEEKQAEPSSESTTSETQPILMVEVVNVTHEKFRQTEEIKVILIIFIKYL